MNPMSKLSDAPLMIFHIDMNFVCLKEAYIRKWLRNLADMGYDAILWELEDKVQWETCPHCVGAEAMTKETLRSLLAYSRTLGLEPIPLLQTIGHAEYVLLQEPYRQFREHPYHHDCYCTRNPEVRQFLKAWIEEYLDLFGDIRYFHLGGDEAYVFGTCPDCQAYADEHSRNQLYADHIIDISESLRERDIRPGIWSDMILAHPDDIDTIPQEFVIWDWNYWSTGPTNEGTRLWDEGWVTLNTLTEAHTARYPELVDTNGRFRPFYTSDVLKRLGRDVILCSAARSAGDTVFLPNYPRHVRNVATAAQKTRTANLLGNCVTSWAVRLNPYETQALVIGLAPYAAAHPKASISEMIQNYGSQLLGSDVNVFTEAVSKLSASVPFTQAGSTGIQWDQLKDSLPAPEHYLRDLLAEWRETQNPTWQERLENVRQSLNSIREGKRLLDCFLQSLPPSSTAYVEAWAKGAYLQYWHAYIARQILEDKADQIPVDLLTTLKEEFRVTLTRAEKSQSAAKNADLVYDATIAYLMESKLVAC
jgi:hypothetical protein